MQGVEEQAPQFGHFMPWTPRTRAEFTALTKLGNQQFNAKSFDTLKAVIFKAFAKLPEARKAFCDALIEFGRLAAIPGLHAASP